MTIKRCLLPVAGYGTRFLPATKSMPKEMLPIVNKPLVQYAVEEAVEAGIRSFGFVTGRGKRAIEDYFDVNLELELKIQGTYKENLLSSVSKLVESNEFAFTRQKHMRGLGHAILSGRNLMGADTFAVILADDLCLADGGSAGVLSQMTKIYDRYKCSVVAIEAVSADQTDRYGIISGEEIEGGLYRVADMIEKPRPEEAPTNLAVIGRYILTGDIFDILKETKPGKNGEIQITDALREQARKGRVLGLRFKGRRFDCGSIKGFVEATNYVYTHLYEK